MSDSIVPDLPFAEARRALRPGGTFAGSDSRWGPLFALAHLGDTMQLVRPSELEGQLHAAGFTEARCDTRRTAVPVHGDRPVRRLIGRRFTMCVR